MLFLILTTCLLTVTHAGCPLRPPVELTSAERTPGDGDYKIFINGQKANGYIPNATYTISLGRTLLTDSQLWTTNYDFTPNGRFSRFMLTVHSQNEPDNLSARVGHFQLYSAFHFGDSWRRTVAFKEDCINTVVEANDIPKLATRVMWRAPPAGSGCVTFTAMILVQDWVLLTSSYIPVVQWFAEDGALTKTICEFTDPEVEDANEMEDMEELHPICEVTEWTDWSPCSSICMKFRSRRVIRDPTSQAECSSLVELFQIHPCTQSACTLETAKEKTICMITDAEKGPCRANLTRWTFDKQKLMCVPFTYGGCINIQNSFLTEDECNSTCGVVRDVLIEQAAYTNVNQGQISTDLLNSLSLPVDCVVTRWSNWSPCSVTCGVGRATSYRIIEREAKNGGRPCPTKLHRRCELPPCE
ncbi:spondin-1 isoform X2 [Monomorium pharaonis]|nr:spondin-1 isoform X2 [Monomorium pharaonis]